MIPSYKRIFDVSVPVMLSLLAQNMMSVINIFFMSRVGEVELGASAIAAIYYNVLYMLGFGFATGAQIIIARRNGEANYKKIGPIVQNSLYFLWTFAIILIVTSLGFNSHVLHTIISDPDIYNACADYLNVRVFGLLFAFTNVAFRAFHVGRTHTRLLSFSALIMAAVNILFDYLLIFGNGGMPEMGIKGAALASIFAEITAAVFFILSASRKKIRKKYALFKFDRLNKVLLKQVLDISVFVMIQYFISVGTWLLFFIIVEKTGTLNLASSNIIRSIYMIITIPAWSYGATVNTFVGNAMGAYGGSQNVLPIIRKVALISVLSSLVLILPVLLFPSDTISLFSSDLPNAAIIEAHSLPSLYVVFGATFCLAISACIFNGVSGTGKTRIALCIELITLTIYVGSLFFFAHFYREHIEVIWFSEYVYWVLLAVLSFIYLRIGKWQNMKL